MVTVRFPNGHVVQYNAATYMIHDEHSTRLLTKQNGVLIARVQHTTGAILEFEPPCRVYNALQEQSLEALTKEVRALKRKIIAQSQKGERR